MLPWLLRRSLVCPPPLRRSLPKQEVCKICFEAHAVADMACARCKHYYCKASAAPAAHADG